jgi:hypothetical protein
MLRMIFILQREDKAGGCRKSNDEKFRNLHSCRIFIGTNKWKWMIQAGHISRMEQK